MVLIELMVEGGLGGVCWVGVELAGLVGVGEPSA